MRPTSFAKPGSLGSCGRKPAWKLTSPRFSLTATAASAWMVRHVSGQVASGTTPPVFRMLSSVV